MSDTKLLMEIVHLLEWIFPTTMGIMVLLALLVGGLFAKAVHG